MRFSSRTGAWTAAEGKGPLGAPAMSISEVAASPGPRGGTRASSSRVRAELDSVPIPTGSYSVIPETSCGDEGLVSTVRAAAKCQEYASGHSLAASSLADWSPAWVGQGLAGDARRAARSRRAKEFSRGCLALFLNNVYAFWLSHLILGQVHLGHITAHV